jgi:hypothetical protein
MAESSKKTDRELPWLEPGPNIVGRPEVSKGLFGDLFKRKAKKPKKSEAGGGA